MSFWAGLANSPCGFRSLTDTATSCDSSLYSVIKAHTFIGWKNLNSALCSSPSSVALIVPGTGPRAGIAPILLIIPNAVGNPSRLNRTSLHKIIETNSSAFGSSMTMRLYRVQRYILNGEIRSLLPRLVTADQLNITTKSKYRTRDSGPTQSWVRKVFRASILFCLCD